MSKRKLDSRQPHRQGRRHERTMNSYDRRPGSRSPGRCIMIVCEGAETEPNYFASLRDHLKLSTISVKIKDRAGAPISVVDEAQAQVEKRKQDIRDGRTNVSQFEAVWCVFDIENPRHNQTFDRAVQVADQNDFQLAVSNPAFEFWYILHYESTTRAYANGREVKDHLCEHIRGYTEAMPIFNRIIELTETAYSRARRLNENHPQGDMRFPNPSTGVYLLVKELVNMSPSGREHFHLV